MERVKNKLFQVRSKKVLLFFKTIKDYGNLSSVKTTISFFSLIPSHIKIIETVSILADSWALYFNLLWML